MRQVFVYLLLISFLLSFPTSASSGVLFERTVNITPYYKYELGNATQPIMLWYLHNQSLEGGNLVMNAMVVVSKADTAINLNLRFEKQLIIKNQGSFSTFAITFDAEAESLREGEVIELSLLWNQVLNTSRLPSRFIPPPHQIHYFEMFLIWLEATEIWDSNVELDVSLWLSYNSSKVDAMNPIFLEHSIYESRGSASLNPMIWSPLFVAFIIYWRRFK